MSEQRRLRLRLEISREAARLFWEQGVAATSGEQIAAAVGLSVRTIWRHFRSKESCAEPIVTQGVEWFMEVLRSWPRGSSLEAHLAAETLKRGHEMRPAELADDMLATRMIALGDTEPALRTAWLMACDQIEREMVTILAGRLGRPADDLEVRLHAATATSVVRVMDEHIGSAVLAGVPFAGFDDLESLTERFAASVRSATGGAVGDPVD
ncbi:TetR/AcrR family transcriptional regulator [Streptomyces sp. 150FB]|uniref:TetR/AcrR family transcriptional regulator n=1 Tax=Streptomyces sp. 150FB TaxID=1576605 RepID=UPI000A6C95A1|nr:TetR/AcrR family transcriptional regulator [Streptomyces sp. 150FB]